MTPAPDRQAPASGMRIAAIVGLVGFAVQVFWIGAFEWVDAYVTAALDTLRGCVAGSVMPGVSLAAPVLSVGFVLLGVGTALRRRTPVVGVARSLAFLALGLLLVEGFKLLIARYRPGTLPWSSPDESFPSGHVASAVLCVGTCLHLLDADRRLRRAIAPVAMVFVVAVAFSRLYLGRHWLTDVTAALLLGVGVSGLHSRAMRWPRLFGAASLVAVLFVAAYGGLGIALPSPSAPSSRPRLDLLQADASGAAARPRVVVPRDARVYRLDGAGRGVFRFATRGGRLPVLKLVARLTAAGGAAQQCAGIEVALDGRPVWRRVLTRRWRAYAFALPVLDRGAHQVDVRMAGVRVDAGHGMRLAVRQMAIEGVEESIRRVADGREPVAGRES